MNIDELLNKSLSVIEKANLERQECVDSLSYKNQKRVQPVHTMYGGAHLFGPKTFDKISQLAMESFCYAIPDSNSLLQLIGDSEIAPIRERIYSRLKMKMSHNCVEDYRIDFEDGYGVRSDEVEDQDAKRVAIQLSELIKHAIVPNSLGIRIKSFNRASAERALRTLRIFLDHFCRELHGVTSFESFTITLPKVNHSLHVSTIVDVLEAYECNYSLPEDFFKLEIIVESPEAILNCNGTISLPAFLRASKGRCHSVHLGVYDFTSSLGVGSAGQSIDHNLCDFARIWMQISVGLTTGISVSDGIINRIPMIPNEMTEEKIEKYKSTWRYNFEQITRSLNLGVYQGWDLHPSQIHIRHLANIVYVFKEFQEAVQRFKMFMYKSAQASHVEGVFDDRASVLGLINFFNRSIQSKILTEEELIQENVSIDRLAKLI